MEDYEYSNEITNLNIIEVQGTTLTKSIMFQTKFAL